MKCPVRMLEDDIFNEWKRWKCVEDALSASERHDETGSTWRMQRSGIVSATVVVLLKM